MKGIYILLIEIKKPINIKIGKLKNIEFKKGLYYYIGSAQNSLEKRIKRHLSNKKKLHWHIDYLLKNKNSKIIKILFSNKNKRFECITAKKLLKSGTPINKFGCSDCKCSSHLIRINKLIKLKGFKIFNQN